MNDNELLAGYSVVKVMKEITDETTGATKVECIHEGIVVQNLGTQVRVFDNSPREQGGDVDPSTAEIFAINGRKIWVEFVKNLREQFKVSSALRFA